MASQRDKQARQPQQPKPQQPKAPPRAGWSLWARLALSVWIAWHLFAVFISPMSTEPTSPLVGMVAQSPYVRWYSDPLYVNHGYHFFGPDPPMGGSLVRWQVYADDGRQIEQGEFPNTKQQWPRLWYHRHMMLADQMTGISVYGDPNQDRQLMLQAYARHLLREYDGAEVRIENVWHRSLHPADVRNDLDPNAPEFFETIMSVSQRRSDLDVPLLPEATETIDAPPEMIPMGVGG